MTTHLADEGRVEGSVVGGLVESPPDPTADAPP
jgi:hypothetical protein